MGNDPSSEILEFWQNAGPSAWWRKDPDFDKQIISKFGKLHERATKKELDNWRNHSGACLALVILLDQFSRNMFRKSPKAFAQDDYALELAKFAVKNDFHQQAPARISGFYYLPFMHSENLDDQETCTALIRKYGNDESLKAAIEHRDIIAKFNRFPHRNTILNRISTSSEQAFLDDGGFAG